MYSSLTEGIISRTLLFVSMRNIYIPREREHTVATVRQLSAVPVLYIHVGSMFLVSFSYACTVFQETKAAVNTIKIPNSIGSPN